MELENRKTCAFREEACRLEGVRLRCDDDVNECRSYILAWYDPKLAAFVVAVGLYEDFRFLRINGPTGKVTNIGGEPHVSPDGTRLAVAQTSECCGASYTGIQVRKTINLEVEFEHAGSIDGDYSFFVFNRWENKDSFVVTTERPLTDKQTGQSLWVRGTTLVERKPDGWALRWIPEAAPK